MNGFFKKFLQENGLKLVIQITTLVGIMVASYFGIRQAITNVEFRVSALEESLEGRQELIGRFIIVEEKVDQLIIIHGKMEKDIEKLDDKIDRLLER